MKKYISIPIFIVSFAIGLFVLYVLGADKKKIYVYATPENKDNIQYKDIADQCFAPKITFKKCTDNSIKIPIQTV